MTVVSRPIPGRLPFTFQVQPGGGRLTLSGYIVGPLHIERLELDVATPVVAPNDSTPQRYQNQRTRLRSLAVRVSAAALGERVAATAADLAAHGITAVCARMVNGFVSVRGRAADGPATADVTFRIDFATTGTHLRALASDIRVHGYLATPGPAIADRILTALLGASEAVDLADKPHARSLCDVEIDLISAALWRVMPPAGWRLPAVADLEILTIRIGSMAADVAFGPAGSRSDELGVRPMAVELAAAHDLMHSADDALRTGQAEEAMRAYRALLASGGPDQPFVLERILSVAAARPMWFIYGRELALQALGRWPQFAAAHSALATISLAQGDAREAALHFGRVAQLATDDDDQAAQAALAGARLLRVLDPTTATQLYELAVERDPLPTEAVDALADRLTSEQRWPELVVLLRRHAQRAEGVDAPRAVALRLRLAETYAHRLNDTASARLELAAAQTLAPDDLAVHQTTATILTAIDPDAAQIAWHQVVRLAVARQDRRAAGKAQAALGELLARGDEPAKAKRAWQRALDLDPAQSDAMMSLARAHARRGDHDAAVELYQRLRNLGPAPHVAAPLELELARSLVGLERHDDAAAALQRAVLFGGETAAEAHVILSEISTASPAPDRAASELDSAISAFVELANARAAASGDGGEAAALRARAAELAVVRATRFDAAGQTDNANADWKRAHDLAGKHAPAIARQAARAMLSRAASPADERVWIDALLATLPPAGERASLLVARAEVRARPPTADTIGALADIDEALSLGDDTGKVVTRDDVTSPLLTRRRAYELQASLLADSGDQRARAVVLGALATVSDRSSERVKNEIAAAAAWLLVNEPAVAWFHSARAHAELEPETPAAVRRDVLTTFGEAAWRQRAWADVLAVYRELLHDAEASDASTYRSRLAVAADHQGDLQLALLALRPLTSDAALTPAVRGQALLQFADIAERTGDFATAGAALESLGQIAEPCPTVATLRARADALFRAGTLFRRADRTDDAVRCFEAALQRCEAHAGALEALEAIWRARGDLERVLAIVSRSVGVTAFHPQRHRLALARLSELQIQLGTASPAPERGPGGDAGEPAAEMTRPSVRITGTQQQNSDAVNAAAAAADRDRIVAAHREAPNDPALLAALLANIGDRDPVLRRAVLDRTAMHATGRAQAIALHELALGVTDPIQATALWNKAYRVDPTYAPVWLPFADALASADELDLAVDLYQKIAESSEYDAARREFARDRTAALHANNGAAALAAERADISVGNAAPGRSDNDSEAKNQNGAALTASFERAERERIGGDVDAAAAQLERILRDYPDNVGALEKLAEIHAARGDWSIAARYLYQLVPFAPTPVERAERLYQLGEAILSHLGDVDRADDVFLRASDLDPSHVPTLRRLLDVYWRADDPAALVDVAHQLVDSGSLQVGSIAANSLAQALVAAALVGDLDIATKLVAALGDAAPASVSAVLAELPDRNQRKLSLGTAATAIAELGQKGVLDLSMHQPSAPPS